MLLRENNTTPKHFEKSLNKMKILKEGTKDLGIIGIQNFLATHPHPPPPITGRISHMNTI